MHGWEAGSSIPDPGCAGLQHPYPADLLGERLLPVVVGSTGLYLIAGDAVNFEFGQRRRSAALRVFTHVADEVGQLEGARSRACA